MSKWHVFVEEESRSDCVGMWNLVEVEAKHAKDAVQQVIAPEQGYGSNGARAFVYRAPSERFILSTRLGYDVLYLEDPPEAA